VEERPFVLLELLLDPDDPEAAPVLVVACACIGALIVGLKP